MEWVDRLRGQLVSLDTAPLIYFIEKHVVFGPKIRPFFVALESREIQAVTSTLTLVEVLVQPIRNGNMNLAREYREILRSSFSEKIIPVSEEVAEEAARLRATPKCSCQGWRFWSSTLSPKQSKTISAIRFVRGARTYA